MQRPSPISIHVSLEPTGRGVGQLTPLCCFTTDVEAGLRAYLGGVCDATALTTVVREIANRAPICAFGTPTAASVLISAQSLNVITLHRGFRCSLLKVFRFERCRQGRSRRLPMCTSGKCRPSPDGMTAYPAGARDSGPHSARHGSSYVQRRVLKPTRQRVTGHGMTEPTVP